MTWCEHAIGGHTPSGNEFLSLDRHRNVPDWYRDLLARARTHVLGGEAPILDFAPKPRKRDGWIVEGRILDELRNNVDTLGLAEQDVYTTSSQEDSIGSESSNH
jgi:hypothetical protein